MNSFGSFRKFPADRCREEQGIELGGPEHTLRLSLWVESCAVSGAWSQRLLGALRRQIRAIRSGKIFFLRGTILQALTGCPCWHILPLTGWLNGH